MIPHSSRARLTVDGKLEVGCATADIGTGTYTILTQIAADAFGLPMADVPALVGDSTLPMAPVEGGSWTAASAGSAVLLACRKLAHTVLGHTRRVADSPLANAAMEQIQFADGRIALSSDPSRSIALADIMRTAGVDQIEEEDTASPDPAIKERFSAYTHSAVFAEVRVDEQSGIVRVTRLVNAVTAGRILNRRPRAARSSVAWCSASAWRCTRSL